MRAYAGLHLRKSRLDTLFTPYRTEADKDIFKLAIGSGRERALPHARTSLIPSVRCMDGTCAPDRSGRPSPAMALDAAHVCAVDARPDWSYVLVCWCTLEALGL